MKQKLSVMLDMQDAMNTRVHEDWRDRNLEWYRAIWVECAELLDHYGWKWWKKQTPDDDQVALELVDIWHFGLSIVLMTHEAKEDGVGFLFDGLHSSDLPPSEGQGDFRAVLEAFVSATLSSKTTFDVTGFSRLMGLIGMDFDELYRRYVGKNVLNVFRQDFGYKEGSYIKVWDGKEDNEHLVELVASLDSDSTDFSEKLYEALAARYPSASATA